MENVSGLGPCLQHTERAQRLQPKFLPGASSTRTLILNNKAPTLLPTPLLLNLGGCFVSRRIDLSDNLPGPRSHPRMSANLARVGAAAAGRLARAQASRAAAQALPQIETSLSGGHSRLRWMDDDGPPSDEPPSLRSRLEADAVTAMGGHWAAPRPVRASQRASASSVAARLGSEPAVEEGA